MTLPSPLLLPCWTTPAQKMVQAETLAAFALKQARE